MTDRLVDADRVAPDGDRPDDAADTAGEANAALDTAPTVRARTSDDDTGGVVAPPAPAAETARFARWRERRKARWDLPPHPKDWRYFVGGFGKVLIVTGLLMFGFVAYQLWGTGIETARAQNKLGNEFSEQIEAATTADEPAIGIDNWVVPRRPVDDTSAAGDDDGTAVPDTDVPVVDTPPDEVLGAGAIGEPSDVVPGGVDLTDYAVEQDVPVIPGEAFARLEIPRIGRSDYVVPGVRVNDLKKGPGHYDGTPLPGQLGNASIAGHRTTYGAPFFNLDQLEPGDELIVTMITGDRFVYAVTGLEVVTAADSWVISTRDRTVAELTLTTCHPKYTARDRLVVHSVLVPEKSSQVGVAEFYDIDEPAPAEDPIPGDDPTFDDAAPDGDGIADEPAADAEDDTAVVAPTLPAIDDADSIADEPDVADETIDDSVGAPAADDTPVADTGGDLDGTAADEPTVPAEPAPLDDDAELDAFEQGWFDDREAFPQIALWASVLILISIIGYQLAKRFRRYWVGVVVTFAPFLVALYFFYQNVNRLLPPGL